jgi:maltose/moltooligosaccharide transporter
MAIEQADTKENKGLNITEALPEVENPYRVGTLVYTKMGLLFLCGWLLWGDFCFMMMETVLQGVLPLKLKAMDVPNVFMMLMITTVPSAMTFFLNPILSFKSDRYRSRWGRRIPFLIFATPFVVLFLALIGFSEQINVWVYNHISGVAPKLSIVHVSMVVIAILILCFQFFHMFILSIYYYLFNDVVPRKFLARFLSLFRMVGVGTWALFNFFLFKYAQIYMREIFIGSAAMFLIAFVLMCFMVKEGQYPPPPENIDKRTGIIASMRTYFTECFKLPFYWFFFLSNAFWNVANCINAFNVFQYLSIGLTLDQLGKVGGISSTLSVMLLYPAGILADRIHPIRVMLIAKIGVAVVTPINLIFLFYDFNHGTAFWICIAISSALLPLNVMYNASSLPMYMRLLPKDRYGQFSSADAMVRAFSMIIGSVLAGLFIDMMKRVHSGSDFCYRYLPVWIFVFEILSLVLLFFLYRKWKQYGGSKNYVPPVAGTKTADIN